VTPHDFSRKLERIYADNLESVILYGSAVGLDYSEKFSDFNVIVILRSCAPGELAKSGKLVRRWVRKGNPSPLFFDPQHVETSRDVFPLEFIDIRDRHEVLFGSDPFKGITVDHKNLRHQCESELKGKVLHLRSIFTQNSRCSKRIASAMITTFPTFAAVFRGILALLSVEAPPERKRVVEELAKHIDFNPTVFMDIINVREGNTTAPRRGDAMVAFENYLTALETITTFVDRFEQRSMS
jgi:hypothetical protein